MSFDPDLCARYVESLVLHDEVERALLVLDNVPAYYRDEFPPVLAKLRADILRACYTPAKYATCDNDAMVNRSTALATLQGTLRGRLAASEIARFNSKGIQPHVIDLGPGTYFIAQGLEESGLQFTYQDVALNHRATANSQDVTRTSRLPFAPVILLALEIIEHVPEPRDLVTDALRHAGDWPERVHLSTPLYTYTTEHADWRTNEGLPHLRAYTPKEFAEEAQQIFPGYHWEFRSGADKIMSLRGQRADTVDPVAL